jgi:hypothetical protein
MTVALTNPTAGFSGGITSSSTSTFTGPTGGGANYAQMFTKAAQFGLQAYSFANELSAISDYKKTQAQGFAQARRVVRERAAFDTERIEIASFRLLKRQTAQASAGGFATGSGSSLAIFNRTEIDKDRATTQVNKSLDDALAEIQRQESEVRRRARGLKTKAIINFASSTLGNFG